MERFTLENMQDETAGNERFRLHAHNGYEIFRFIEGDSEYIVEGARYALSPGDLILIRPGEMHRVYHKSEGRYCRTVINVEEDFFKEMNCEESRAVFWERRAGEKNKIESAVAERMGITDCFLRIERYSDEFRDASRPIVRAAIAELLFLIADTREFSPDHSNEKLKRIIAYITENFRERISLSGIAEKYYMDKAHLSRSFRKTTGYTVNEYITKKRMEYVRERCREGDTITHACLTAGFPDYSTFYKTYRREHGSAPHEELKKHDT